MVKLCQQEYNRLDKTLGQRIKSVRSQAGLTQEDAAARLGIAYPTLSKYEQGHRTPDAELLNRMAKEFGCDPGWLLTGEGSMWRGVRAAEPPAAYESVDLVSIPYYPEVAVSAGPGAVPDETEPPARLALPAAWLRRVLHVSVEGLCLLPVRCDSMLPTLSPGDLVLVDQTARTLTTDGLYVYRLDDGLHVKRLQQTSGRRVLVLSDNPLYQRLEVELPDLHLIGRVVLALRRL